MRIETQRALNQINETFYRRYALDFSSTRQSAWRGWERALPEPRPAHILDLGCGNGRFLGFLSNQAAGGPEPQYVGTDLSLALLGAARAEHRDALFVCHDLLQSSPLSLFRRQRFDLVVAFGVLHHIPGFARRVELLSSALDLTTPGGSVIFTFWQFETDSRFDSRRAPWSSSPVKIDTADLEQGDHLLRWGGSSAPDAVRYCHSTTASEVDLLAARAGAVVSDSYLEDGRNRRLNLYSRFQAS